MVSRYRTPDNRLPMLQVRKAFTLDQFELGLERLAEGEATLSIPNGITAEAVGATAALMQLIATWGKTADAQLRLYADDLNTVSAKNFAETPVGLAALNAARAVTSLRGDLLSRREAMLLSENYLRLMHDGNLDAVKGANAITLLCLDNAQHLGRPVRLYGGAGDNVRPARDFADLLRSCFRTLSVSDRRLQAAMALAEPAAGIAFEAFQNTHEHARTDWKKDELARSTRGLTVGWRYVERTRLADAAGDHLVLRRYFDALSDDWEQGQHAQFIELSVFDGGPGLAQSWFRAQQPKEIRQGAVSLEEELNAVYGCLRKGGTTKGNSSAGNGLYRILRLTSERGGFVRIRTGRLSLARSFARPVPFEPDDIQMEDAISGGAPIRPRAWADGTVLTIMLPLNRGGRA